MPPPKNRGAEWQAPKVGKSRRRGGGMGRGVPKIWGFPFDICATAEASNFKFGMHLGLTKAYHKNHNQRKKWA